MEAERKDDTPKCCPEGHFPDLAHLVEIGLEAGDKHQEQHASLREVADECEERQRSRLARFQGSGED